MEKKRVCCLYRVSTKGQVDQLIDDIPMQKSACRSFIKTKPDWFLFKEFYEKGISGFKVSADDRDAIQDLRKMALNNEFDVLLVYMFDRIGRKDDETPFVVQWFVEQGIEVWSVKEGQQRFDHHVDKLINYIHYWQASGESLKTSIRTQNGLAEAVRQGHFKGGVAAYGYELADLGRTNKRGRAVKDLIVNEQEAAVVRYIFDLYVHHGLGTHTIARRLEKEGIYNRKGENFVGPTIKNMLKNKLYIGILTCGDVEEGPFEHLRIIDDATFYAAQEIAKQRSNDYQGKRRVPMKPSERCLLAGNIFCGECGARLVTSSNNRRIERKDGTFYERRVWRYICYNHMRHRERCNGQSGYSALRVDKAVEEAVQRLLDSLQKVPREDIIAQRLKNLNESNQRKRESLSLEVVTKKQEVQVLQNEIVKALAGESAFTPEVLSDQIEKSKSELIALSEKLGILETEIQSNDAEERRALEDMRKLIGYGEMFSGCDINQKRMIVCELIDEVRVSRGYEIELKLNCTYEQFFEKVDKSIVEREDYQVNIDRDEPMVLHASLEGLSRDEAIAELMRDDPNLQYEDAAQMLDAPIPGERKTADLFRTATVIAFREEVEISHRRQKRGSAK